MHAMEELFQSGLDTVKLHVFEISQVLRDRQTQIACHDWRTIADRDATAQTITDVARSCSQVVDVGNNATGLFYKGASVFGGLGPAR